MMKAKTKHLLSGGLIGLMFGFYTGAYIAVECDLKEKWNPIYLFPILLAQIVLLLAATTLGRAKQDSEHDGGVDAAIAPPHT
jgi:hypothetical protein